MVGSQVERIGDRSHVVGNGMDQGDADTAAWPASGHPLHGRGWRKAARLKGT